MIIVSITIYLASFFLSISYVLAANLPVPVIINRGFTAGLLNKISEFLITAGMILAAIVIVISGIRWMLAGGGTKSTDGAQNMLKSAIYGAAVILGAGLIIKTVSLIVNQSFFG